MRLQYQNWYDYFTVYDLKKNLSSNDPIMMHILGSIPESNLQKGVPSTAYFYASFVQLLSMICSFNQLLHDARVAAKVPSNSGLAGQLLGRTVVALMGTEGVDKEDPLVRLETVQKCLLQ